jgi:leucyl-tRNA synthetase
MERIADALEEKRKGRRTVAFRLRDWCISRQRYWGAPIPIIYCDACGIVLVPEEELPVLLPHIEAWRPGEDGRSPLANAPNFVNVPCPNCGRPGRRETDTLDGFACSSWYALRFVSPRCQEQPFDPVALAHWGAPDLYVGGEEHAVMHLLYARFWAKVMADAGLIPFREPFPTLRCQGVMHVREPETGKARRMSKSVGNVVTPDSMVDLYGADALRVYLLFMAPLENDTIWDEQGMTGAKRFLSRTWQLVSQVGAEDKPRDLPPSGLIRRLHQTIRQVTADIERFHFNTAVAALMTLLNTMVEHKSSYGVTAELEETVQHFVLLLAPFAPHIAEELWERLGGEYSVHQQAWPVWNENLAAEETVTLVIQVNGRVRDRMVVPANTPVEQIEVWAMNSEKIARLRDNQDVERVIIVPGRVVNIVTRK